jgi:EAL domain-containing protein (putative c-di-GMP-specific phosphodiesterase class I)
VVARLGGDQFALLLRDGGSELAQSVALRIERAFETPLTLDEHTVDLRAGIGFACWPQHALDADTLLARAEVAMLAAKRGSRRVLAYDPAFDASSARTLAMLGELRQAAASSQLQLWLQPRLALDSGNVVGAAALVRWQHPQRGLLPPQEFVPLAELTGFIRTLTLWAFEEAARQWRVLQAAGMRITLSVTLSARDLLDHELPQKLDAVLVRERVPAEAFCLEVTEGAILDDPARAQATLSRLSALGFRLAIDDFGTGGLSLARLKRLPVHVLKVAGSFVRTMDSDADDAKMVRSTIEMAHTLGLAAVAEGVESAAACGMLRELQCDQALGLHLGPPMTAAEFAQWNARWLTHLRPDVPHGPVVLH